MVGGAVCLKRTFFVLRSTPGKQFLRMPSGTDPAPSRVFGAFWFSLSFCYLSFQCTSKRTLSVPSGVGSQFTGFMDSQGYITVVNVVL